MKKFIILSSQRTGSGFLQQSLDAHPDIRCFGEVLIGYGGLYSKMPPNWISNNRRARTLWQAVFSGGLLFPGHTIEKHFRHMETEPNNSIGLRIMYNQLKRNPLAIKKIKSLKEIKIIHLQRGNLLKKYVSHILMHQMIKINRKHAHLTNAVPTVRITVDPQSAISYFRYETNSAKQAIANFHEHEILDVLYEEMIQGNTLTHSVGEAITEFLEVCPFTYTSNLVKTNPNNLSEFVENYQELSAALMDTEWKRFLD